tara:strand:+ start:543 stop:1025 length:483 start_codon:yes stop_codon:yes gene_type:complete
LKNKEKIIFCTELFEKIVKQHNYKKIDLNNFKESIEIIKKHKKYKKIEIWGITTTKKTPYNKALRVNDHKNFTGNNPLIGNQKKATTSFPEMTKLYSKTKEGVVTVSRGKHFLKDNQYEHPTENFCYFGIIARAVGIKKIDGYLLNKKISTLKKHIVAKN